MANPVGTMKISPGSRVHEVSIAAEISIPADWGVIYCGRGISESCCGRRRRIFMDNGVSDIFYSESRKIFIRGFVAYRPQKGQCQLIGVK